MAKFEELNERELNGLPDERLIKYISAARRAGAADAVQLATKVLVARHWANVRDRVRMKVRREDVEDVTQLIVMGAIASAFDGSSKGEFIVWLRRITQRRIADYYRDRERNPEFDPLPEEHEGNEEIYGDIYVDPDAEGSDASEVRMVFTAVMREHNERDRRVILLQIEGYSGAETASLVNQDDPGAKMTEDNVHKIFSRFRKRLRGELGE